ncbi:TetR/AcrR family transcriptional regulator [Streptomyces thermodiastaticus]|jgi:AcrR family transcriptional regulator|uniref:TetR/AcrR family transcriptional regulator n=1 Tax=Streptomyces thermodiastaticus TaxID=44061 RepID=UPI00167B6E63|nr:TetR/AcrR family transcriptional regulator [Streptomyces thermodiastaticus]MCE7551866.1 TetR/AcrR family transcriptional regulator [Streptomyces thermodiastaticus]GHF79643.1 TetR family transcriptional regulator [Streptomyces thermodiastaticus]
MVRAVHTRERILGAAAELLNREGRSALSTRAVSAAAGVQPPTLYRLFGDKAGLLDALAAYGFEQYLAGKQALEETDDPVADLRRSWDLHVGFGLSRPACYVLMYGEGRRRGFTEAGAETMGLLRRNVARIAAAGRLRMSVDRATWLLHANGVGAVLSLIAMPPLERDPELATAAFEHVLRTITVDGDSAAGAPSGVADRAAALREALHTSGTTVLTRSESALLADWLDRLADTDDAGSAGAAAATGRRNEPSGRKGRP